MKQTRRMIKSDRARVRDEEKGEDKGRMLPPVYIYRATLQYVACLGKHVVNVTHGAFKPPKATSSLAY